MDKILCWQPTIGSFLLQLLSHSPRTFYFSDNCIFRRQLFQKQMPLNYNITVLNLLWNYSSSACRELFTDKTGVIMSPYYPGYYANDSWCEWLVTAAIGHVIRLEFFYFQLEATGPQCLSDYVEVFDGNSTYSTSLGRFCGHTHPAMLESSSNNLLVVFKSDNKGIRMGFKAYYDMRKGEVLFVFWKLLLEEISLFLRYNFSTFLFHAKKNRGFGPALLHHRDLPPWNNSSYESM